MLGANTLTVAGTSSVSGTNTGDQTSVTGNAGTATALATARNIFNISFNGTANVAGDATNTGHFASIPGTGEAGHFVTENGAAPTLIAGRSAWYSNGSGVPSFKNGTGTAVTLVRSSDLGTGIATFLTTPSSANLAAAVTDETGTGVLVFNNSPSVITPAIQANALSFSTILTTAATGSNKTVTFPDAAGTVLLSGDIGVSVQAYDADLTTWAGITPAANVGTFLATPSGANLASALTSALPVSKGGTGLTAGTSGGIPAFTATGTIASSALLAANALMIGGGAGVAPSTTTTGAGVLVANINRPIFTTTATAAGTTTLTVTSAATQEFTGSTTQTVTMPVVTTLVAGWATLFVNKSTGNVTLNSSGGNAIVVLAAGQSVTLVCKSISADTTAAAWDVVGKSPRILTGSASLNNANFSSNQSFPVTVTGAAAGDTVSFSYPPDIDGVVVLSAIVVTTDTVTFYFNTMTDALGLPQTADWTSSGNTLRAQIIK